MYKLKFNKVMALGLLVAVLATTVPSVMAASSYLGANGQTYYNDDFWDDDFSVTVSQDNGYATFCWEKPDTYYEGYDIFVTEGSFVGGLTNYEPKTLSKNSTCYKYPQQITEEDTKVVAHVYPYIELASGARKYIQPGAKAIAPVKAAEEGADAMQLAIDGWQKGMPHLTWEKYEGDFDGYALLTAPGKVSASDWKGPSKGVTLQYLTKSETDYQYVNLGYSSTSQYTVRIVPYQWEDGEIEYIEGAYSNVITFKADVDIEPMDLWISSWNDGYPKISWSAFTGLDFDGYSIFVHKGNVSKSKAMEGERFTVSKSATSYQMTKMMANTTYTILIVPYITRSNSTEFVTDAYSDPLVFTVGGGQTGGTYVGKDGTVYTEADFLKSKTVIEASAQNKNKVQFHWSKPGKKFDGYALYVTEGEFEGGLDNYDPIYLNKNKTSYMYPKKVKANTRVSAYIYPYIELSSGARKFIQPGSQTSIVMGVEQEQTLAAPTIIKPKADAILSNFPRRANILWTKVKGAAYYEVEIACDVCKSSTTKWMDAKIYKMRKTSFMTPALAGDNEFRVRVRAVSTSGTAGHWSDYKYFRFDTAD